MSDHSVDPSERPPTGQLSETRPETLQQHQANERTVLAWLRTGIALMAFGFAIARFGVFIREVSNSNHAPPPAPLGIEPEWLGVAMVGLGLLVNAGATWRYDRVRRAIVRGAVSEARSAFVYLFAGLLVIIGLFMTALLARALSR